ncbi:hypothetical protein BDA99DRAFT_536441 [Phascolomyces articulosus]|uniref:Uncharacterized protein n=1 Tax=Phascolomyces articulosus TaxID=60185 RepID=A0AAD5K1W6_9FUNG|nr:hypothetical protein BDA99DRAFT_536441 [Phascolomyces articulosus]
MVEMSIYTFLFSVAAIIAASMISGGYSETVTCYGNADCTDKGLPADAICDIYSHLWSEEDLTVDKCLFLSDNHRNREFHLLLVYDKAQPEPHSYKLGTLYLRYLARYLVNIYPLKYVREMR